MSSREKSKSLPVQTHCPAATRVDDPPRQNPPTTRLWLCAHLPQFIREVCARGVEPAVPVAVADGEGVHRRIVACNAGAYAAGVRPGLGLNAALALSPQLCVMSREPHREQLALQRLGAWAGQFTSLVSLDPPDTMLLEVQGSLRLFGGLQSLRERVRTGLAELGYSSVLAVAPAPLAAVWLARAGEEHPVDATVLAGRLGRLPLTCTGWPGKLQSALRGMGIRTLGDCLRLPRDGFARRFGAARLAELDRALGRRSDPREPIAMPVRFDAGIELPALVHEVQPLLFVLRRLFGELRGFLRARARGVQQLELRLHHQARHTERLQLRLTRPSRDAEHLLTLAAEHLQRFTLRAPVSALSLHAANTYALPDVQVELFGEASAATTDWPLLLERLRARLGEAAVHGLKPVAEHRPEAAWCIAEPGTPAASMSTGWRPLWMLASPQRLEVHGGRPAFGGVLELERGPERIESGWWDGGDVTRDYYVACAPEGTRVWIYRERRGRREWFLHGLFG